MFRESFPLAEAAKYQTDARITGKWPKNFGGEFA
jgi:hypothetical protein